MIHCKHPPRRRDGHICELCNDDLRIRKPAARVGFAYLQERRGFDTILGETFERVDVADIWEPISGFRAIWDEVNP